MKVLVTGANRGIGLEFCRQYAARGEEVVGVCRHSSAELAASGVRIVEGIDVTSDDARGHLRQALAGAQIDILINNAGLLETVELANMDAGAIRRQVEVNAIAPLLVTHTLLDHLAPGSKVAIVTSRMGSVGDNDSGGYYGYRMSKAAANMAGKSLAVDLKGRGIAVALLHPGYVRTGMTGGMGHIDPDEAARGLIAVMDRLSLATSGQFWHMNGTTLPW
jgi:NAD(P)-dependent dehydrogenase (short-subunit alcohol dehydrogenase family)